MSTAGTTLTPVQEGAQISAVYTVRQQRGGAHEISQCNRMWDCLCIQVFANLCSRTDTLAGLCLFLVPCLQESIRDGQTWHVVDHDWFEHWKAYTGFDSFSECVKNTPIGERPGPIDNSKLIESEYSQEAAVLRKSLMENIDYVMLEERTAKLLEDWYGGPGPIIERQVITVGGISYASKQKVELYPVFLKLIPCGQGWKTGRGEGHSRMLFRESIVQRHPGCAAQGRASA